ELLEKRESRRRYGPFNAVCGLVDTHLLELSSRVFLSLGTYDVVYKARERNYQCYIAALKKIRLEAEDKGKLNRLARVVVLRVSATSIVAASYTNLLINRDSNLKLADFSLVRAFGVPLRTYTYKPDITLFPDYKATFPKWKRPDTSIIPGIEPTSLELLEALLEYDPAHRLSAKTEAHTTPAVLSVTVINKTSA
ncbi:hypothetical protein N7467_002849, partial [Penicillium canescens]